MHKGKDYIYIFPNRAKVETMLRAVVVSATFSVFFGGGVGR